MGTEANVLSSGIWNGQRAQWYMWIQGTLLNCRCSFPELAVVAVATTSWKTLEVPQMHAGFCVVENNYSHQTS